MTKKATKSTRPKTAKLGPVRYKLQRAKLESKELDDDGLPNWWWGDCDTRKQIIRTSKKNGYDVECTVTMHEILHGIAASGNNTFKEKDEEAFIRLIDTQLVQFIRDNKELVEYLAGDAWQ